MAETERLKDTETEMHTETEISAETDTETESFRSLTGGSYLEPVKPVYNEPPKMSLYRGGQLFGGCSNHINIKISWARYRPRLGVVV